MPGDGVPGPPEAGRAGRQVGQVAGREQRGEVEAREVAGRRGVEGLAEVEDALHQRPHLVHVGDQGRQHRPDLVDLADQRLLGRPDHAPAGGAEPGEPAEHLHQVGALTAQRGDRRGQVVDRARQRRARRRRARCPSRSMPSRTRSMSSVCAFRPVTRVFSRESSVVHVAGATVEGDVELLDDRGDVGERAARHGRGQGDEQVGHVGCRRRRRERQPVAVAEQRRLGPASASGGVSSTYASPIGAVVRTSARVPARDRGVLAQLQRHLGDVVVGA